LAGADARLHAVKTSLLTGLTLLAALIWSVALIVNAAPLQPAPGLLVGVGMLLTATVAVVGIVVVGGRWAHRLAAMSLGITVALGSAATVIAVVALYSPTVISTVRKLPAAAGPPPRAVLPPLILLTAPAVLGFAGNDARPVPLLVVGLLAPIAAFAYSRVLPGGLLAIRVLWPLLAIATAPWLGWVAGSTAVVMALVVSVIAWDPSVKASYHPPRETGSAFPIPPELTPKEIRDAAGIDERGRPLA
jgi:MFS family permease